MTLRLAILLVLAPLALAAAAAVVAAVLRRPQRGILLLAALAPFDGLLLVLPLPAPAAAWKEALLVLVLAGALRTPGGPPATRRPPWVPALLALLALSAGSAAAVAVAGAGPSAAAAGLKVGFTWALLVPVLWRCPLTRRDRDRLVTALMTTGAVTAAVGLLQHAVGQEVLASLGYAYDSAIRTSGGVLRAFSTFNQPFPFGLFQMTVLLVGVPVALAEPHRIRSRLFLLATPLLLAGLLSSIVRAAVLGVLVGGVFLFVHRYRALGVLVLPGTLALLLAAAVVPASTWAPLLSSSSLQERGTGWSGVVDDVLSAPLGHGLASTGASAELAARLTGSTAPVLQPDNQYVKMLYELGSPGLWLFLLLLVAALRHARSVSLRAPDPVDAALAAGTAACVLASAAASTVSTYLEIFPLDLLFWLLLGVLPSLGTRASSCPPSPSGPGGAASRPTAASSSTG